MGDICVIYLLVWCNTLLHGRMLFLAKTAHVCLLITSSIFSPPRITSHLATAGTLTLQLNHLYSPSFKDHHLTYPSIHLQLPSRTYNKINSPLSVSLSKYLLVLFRFPDDEQTYSVDTQFLWGSALMIVPVLREVSAAVCVLI